MFKQSICGGACMSAVSVIKGLSAESSAKRARQKFSTLMFPFSVFQPSGKTCFCRGSSQLETRQPTAVLNSLHATFRHAPPRLTSHRHPPARHPCLTPFTPVLINPYLSLHSSRESSLSLALSLSLSLYLSLSLSLFRARALSLSLSRSPSLPI